MKVYRLCRLAGVGGPGPYTLWQLEAMALEGLELHWQTIAQLSTVIARCHGNKRAKPKHFNPLAREQKQWQAREWREWREQLDMPDEMDNEEIRKRFDKWQASEQ